MWPMIAMVGLSLLSSMSSASAQQEQAKLNNKLKAAQNKRLMVSAYNSIGRINENKIQAAQQSQSVAQAIQAEEISVMGSAEVAAGAAGVKGRSVDQAFASINRAAATKELQRSEELQSAMNAYEAQMADVWQSATNAYDISPNADESFNTLGVLTSVGGSALSAYGMYNSSMASTTGLTGASAASTAPVKMAGADAGSMQSTASPGLWGSFKTGIGNLTRSTGSLLGFK